MRTILAKITRFYGANPLHLLALLACFTIAGYAVFRVADDPTLPAMLLWFGGAIISHDLVLFPLYAIADRSLTGALRRLRGARESAPPLVPVVNYIRVPVLAACLLFLLFYPGIVTQGEETYRAATGQTQEPFLERYLLLTAALFTTSAVAYALRLAHVRRRPSDSVTGSRRTRA